MIATVKAALVAALQAALPDVQVIYGPVGSVSLTKAKVLEVGARVNGTVDPTALDFSTSDTLYRINCVASAAYSVGTDMAVVETAAEAIFTAVIATLQADPTLGLDATSASVSGDFEMQEGVDREGISAAFTFGVSVFSLA